MEVTVPVYAAKGKSKAKNKKRSKQLDVGDKLEDFRAEIDSLTPHLPLDESEEPEDNLKAELDRLPSPVSQDPKELEETEEAEDLEKAAEYEETQETKQVEEDAEHEEPKAEGNEELKELAPWPSNVLINGEVSKTVQAWYRDLLHNLRIVSTPPEVTNVMFYDAKKLFGVNCDKKVTLRNPGYGGGTYKDIVLPQFDPNFMSTEVVCLHPSCNNINPAAAKCGKRDLYLCPDHQQVLRNKSVSELAKNSVQISTIADKPEPGQFAGYTLLIGLLEGAFQDGRKFKIPQGKSPMVQEAILNVRNFLIITSTVLNPDEDNLGIALPPVVEILKLILENPDAVERLVASLQKVIKMILSAFGVGYTWVAFALKSPGAQAGAGVGGFMLVSRLVGSIALASLSPLNLVVSAVVGGILGGLTGNAIYSLSRKQSLQEKDQLRPNRQPHNQYPVYLYSFNGDAEGGFDLYYNFLQKMLPSPPNDG